MTLAIGSRSICRDNSLIKPKGKENHNNIFFKIIKNQIRILPWTWRNWTSFPSDLDEKKLNFFFCDSLSDLPGLKREKWRGLKRRWDLWSEGQNAINWHFFHLPLSLFMPSLLALSFRIPKEWTLLATCAKTEGKLTDCETKSQSGVRNDSGSTNQNWGGTIFTVNVVRIIPLSNRLDLPLHTSFSKQQTHTLPSFHIPPTFHPTESHQIIIGRLSEPARGPADGTSKRGPSQCVNETETQEDWRERERETERALESN